MKSTGDLNKNDPEEPAGQTVRRRPKAAVHSSEEIRKPSVRFAESDILYDDSQQTPSLRLDICILHKIHLVLR